MNGENRKDQLFRRTLEARRKQLRTAADGAAGPRPGDLFVLAGTAAFSVEWAVLEVDHDRGRVLVVAADLDPRIGTGDVAIAADSACGSLTLRCAFSAWIDAAVCETGRRTGALDAGDLERARRKAEGIVAGTASGSLSESETENEPGFLDLRRDLDRARAALVASTPRRAAAVSFFPRSRGQTFSTPWVLAASILLALILGFGGGWILSSRQPAPEAAEVLVSSPLAFFPAVGAVRGPGTSNPVKTLTLDPTVSHFIIVLGLAEPFPAYRVEIAGDGEPQPAWSGELPGSGLTELTFVLPRRRFAAGRYRIRLAGWHDDRAEELAEYLLNIEVEGDGGLR